MTVFLTSRFLAGFSFLASFQTGLLAWRRAVPRWLTALLAIFLMGASVAWARPAEMHIMEGFLPPLWVGLWFLVAIPFWVIGLRRVQQVMRDKPETKLLLGLSGAYVFVLSALKIPSGYTMDRDTYEATS